MRKAGLVRGRRFPLTTGTGGGGPKAARPFRKRCGYYTTPRRAARPVWTRKRDCLQFVHKQQRPAVSPLSKGETAAAVPQHGRLACRSHLPVRSLLLPSEEVFTGHPQLGRRFCFAEVSTGRPHPQLPPTGTKLPLPLYLAGGRCRAVTAGPPSGSRPGGGGGGKYIYFPPRRSTEWASAPGREGRAAPGGAWGRPRTGAALPRPGEETPDKHHPKKRTPSSRSTDVSPAGSVGASALQRRPPDARTLSSVPPAYSYFFPRGRS